MYQENKPKANWAHNFGPVSVSDKGHMKITDEESGHTAMFSPEVCKVIVNNSEDLLKALTLAEEIKGIRRTQKDQEKIRKQAEKALSKEAQKVQASIEALQRAGVNTQDLLAFLSKKAV